MALRAFSEDMATTDTLSYVEQRKASPLRSVLQSCFSFPVLLGTFLVVINYLIERPFRLEPDTWWQIKQGAVILSTGRWPTFDVYSFTARGAPAMANEWGGEIVMALAMRLGGLRGLHFLLLLLPSIILLLIYYYAWLRCRNSKAAFLATVLVTPLAAMCFTLRPQLLGYIFLLITLIVLERYRLGMQKSLWILPPLFLIWVNTHGTFILGFLALAIYWLCGLKDFSCAGLRAERWKHAKRLHLELICLLSLAVMPLTPYGTRIAAVPFGFATALPLNLTAIQEWQPLNMGFWQAKLIIILLLGFIAALMAFRPGYRLEESALFALFFYETCVHFRFVVILAMVFAPLLAVVLARWAPAYDPRIDKHVLNAALMLGAVALMVTYLPSASSLRRKVEEKYPVRAVDYIRHHPLPQPMFNTHGFGSYLVWKLGPAHKVFIDGRGDFYERAGVLADYLDIVRIKPDALRLLRRYDIQSCLIKRGSPLATLLLATHRWQTVYSDNLVVILVRANAARTGVSVSVAGSSGE